MRPTQRSDMSCGSANETELMFQGTSGAVPKLYLAGGCAAPIGVHFKLALGKVTMRTPVAIILTAVALVVVGTLAITDKSCKSGRHGWCAPMSAAPDDVKLDPPAQYNHPYAGPVVERVMPAAKARALCTSQGALRRGIACSWVSDGTCYLVLPSDEQAPVSTYRRHETAHCNGWPANHPRG
jgi:hypothetical protein